MTRMLALQRLPVIPDRADRSWMGELTRALETFIFYVTSQINSQVQGVGADIASDWSISPTHPIHKVTGSATISKIEIPDGFTGPLFLLNGGSWALDSTAVGSNIAASLTPVANTCQGLIYNGTLWYPLA